MSDTELLKKLSYNTSMQILDTVTGLEYTQSVLNMLLDSMDGVLESKAGGTLSHNIEDWRNVLAMARDRIRDEKTAIDKLDTAIVQVLEDTKESA